MSCLIWFVLFSIFLTWLLKPMILLYIQQNSESLYQNGSKTASLVI